MTPQSWPLFTVRFSRVYAVLGWVSGRDPVLAPLDVAEMATMHTGRMRYFTSEQAARASIKAKNSQGENNPEGEQLKS